MYSVLAGPYFKQNEDYINVPRYVHSGLKIAAMLVYTVSLNFKCASTMDVHRNECKNAILVICVL